MGCLKNFTRSIFLTVVVVGFVALGGHKFLFKCFDNWLHPSQEVIMERAQKVGDFSKVDKEFEIEKAAGVMGYNAVLAEHKASGQKMVVVDTSKKQPLLTRSDIEAQNAEERIKAAISKFKYQTAAIEDFHITEKGTMTSYGQQIPYAKFTARIKKLPVGEISGIISVAKDEKGNDKILISANQGSKYSQLITNEFFKEVK